jgi:outer membrane protein OmpA-like peptidoglycan-associated protein
MSAPFTRGIGGFMSVRSNVVVWVALSGLALGACSSALPPPELVQARASYKHAEEGPATRLKPAELHVAKEALDRAEAEFADSPSDHKTADLAYVAARKAEYVDEQATAALALETKAKLEAETAKVQADQLDATNKKVKGLEGTVAQTSADLAKQKDETAKQKDETAKEKAARIAAEAKAKEAMDALTKTLAVKSEDRGMVITLSGGVLFATGQATVLPGAQSQLDKVAEALKTQTERSFVVEGHTDNQGTESANQTLSQKRADAVRDYLIVHGVAAGSITAVGKGQSQPVADNKTVEGKAMNRRVEIVVQKP